MNKKVDLSNVVKDLKYKAPSKKRKDSTLIAFRISGFQVGQLKSLSRRAGVNENIFCKNLLLAFLEKEEGES